MKQINQIGEKMKNKKNTIHPKDRVVVRSSLVREIKSAIEFLDITYGLGECPTMDRIKRLLKAI